MKFFLRRSYIAFVILATVVLPRLHASVWTDHWCEDSYELAYNPFQSTIAEDYFPCVIYDEDGFNGHGDSFPYKMWHQGPCYGDGTLAYSCSSDGVHWKIRDILPHSPAYHPCVIYDKDGFGGSNIHYKMWFWTGIASSDASSIMLTESSDGLIWTEPECINQDPSAPLAVGVAGEWFYNLYGPGAVIYNAFATDDPVRPLSYRYVMYFHTGTEGQGPGTSVEQVGLAFSTDGIYWSRFGDTPVIIPSGDPGEWDSTHIFNGTFLKSVDGDYHLFYSGANDLVSPQHVLSYAHGIGIAHSSDGVHWTRDRDNPFLSYADDIDWRCGRTYTPTAIYQPSSQERPRSLIQLWFTGGSGNTPGENQAVGHAVSPYPIMPPSHFIGATETAQFLNRKVVRLTTSWIRSPELEVSSYRIYRDGRLIGSIASSSTSFVVYSDADEKSVFNEYKLAAIDRNGSESVHVPLVIA